MTPEKLDFYFPFVVFAYGILVSFALGNSTLMALAEQRLSPELLSQFRAKRFFAGICLLVGGLWALQNIWLG